MRHLSTITFSVTAAKEAAPHEWCGNVSEQTGQVWPHVRINQVDFDMLRPKTLYVATYPGERPLSMLE